MGLTRTVDPVEEPLLLADVKKHCEVAVDDTHHDDHLMRILRAVTRDVERITGRALITQTWELRLSGFPGDLSAAQAGLSRRQDKIWLPRPPLQSVTSIEYVDTDGDNVTLASSKYQIATKTMPSYVRPAYQETWPVTRPDTVDPVTVTYVAGYGDDYQSIPDEIGQVIAEWTAFRFFNRGDVQADMPRHIQWALRGLKVGAVMGWYEITAGE